MEPFKELQQLVEPAKFNLTYSKSARSVTPLLTSTNNSTHKLAKSHSEVILTSDSKQVPTIKAERRWVASVDSTGRQKRSVRYN